MSANVEPLYQRFSELFEKGFKIDWVTAGFISITHVICIIGTPVAYYFAPEGLWKAMLAWTLVHAFIACLSTTVYSHRLVSHGAANKISWPVHIVFGYVGQVLAIQGSVLRWASMHILHHGVDKTGQHQLDPYSATWFGSTWRNFLWSHMLTYFFFHPKTEAWDRAIASKSTPLIVWQDKLYIPLLVTLNFLLPMAVGYWLAGAVGAACLMIASIGGFILAQHNTWTVNSVTHLWGSKDGANSSAKNNYIWMGPLGEGNHHADHHDHGKDFRNGFGVSGWLLDPTRYVILALRGMGLVKGLQRASKVQEARIVARRAMNEIQQKVPVVSWDGLEGRFNALRADWLEAVAKWESYKKERKAAYRELKCIKRRGALSQAMFIEKRRELRLQFARIKREMKIARATMQAKRHTFFLAIDEARFQFA